MKLYQIYFSPTGGTKKVLEMISARWDCEKIEIDLSNAEDLSKYILEEEDVCIVGAPVFGGRIPALAVSGILKMKGNQAKAIPVAVYGNRAYEDALLELKDSLTEAGFACVAGIAAVAEHSIMRQFAAGRPDAKDEQQLHTFADKIKERLEQGSITDLSVPGNSPYKEYKIMPMIPEAGEDCNNCGICALKCPVGAISGENVSEVDASKCISCMRCTAVCPKKVRHVKAEIIQGASQKLEKFCSDRKDNELFLTSFPFL